MDIKEKAQELAKSLYKMVKKQSLGRNPKDVIQDVLDPNTEAQIDPNLVPVPKTGILNKNKKFKKSEDFAKDFLKNYVDVANNYKNLEKSSKFESFQEQKAGAPMAPREKMIQRQARKPIAPPQSQVPNFEQSPVKEETYRGLKDATRVGFQEAKDPETSYKENVKNKNMWLRDLLEINRRGQVKNLEGMKPKEDKQKDIKTTIMPMAASEKRSK